MRTRQEREQQAEERVLISVSIFIAILIGAIVIEVGLADHLWGYVAGAFAITVWRCWRLWKVYSE